MTDILSKKRRRVNRKKCSYIVPYSLLCYPIISHLILFRYSTLSYPILFSPILSYHILSYPILFYSIQSYFITFYPILSYLILFSSSLSSLLSYLIQSYLSPVGLDGLQNIIQVALGCSSRAVLRTEGDSTYLHGGKRKG